MADENDTPQRPIRGVAAGAIHFDELGRIIVDPKMQAEMGGFHLPPWAGGPPSGGTDGTDIGCPVTACQPETVCADTGCVPKGNCADTGCVPKGNCADTGCVPKGNCADTGCVPQGVCADTGCVPKGICADTACQPQSACTKDAKCVNIFCKDKNSDCPTNLKCDPGGPGTPSGPAQQEGPL